MPSKSLYQLTKTSIEHGILQLQQKIRRRKQLELGKEIQQNIMINNDKLYQYELELGQLHNVYGNAKYDPLLNYIPPSYVVDPSVQYIESILMADSLKYSPQDWTYEQLKDKIRKQSANLDYLRKLERMKQQNLFIQDRLSSINKLSVNQSLNYQRLPYPSQNISKKQLLRQHQINQYKRSRSPYQQQPVTTKKNTIQKSQYRSPINYIQQNTPLQKKNYNQKVNPYTVFQYDQEPKSQDSSLLVDKYYRGIRAEQYNRDMQRLALIQQKLRMVENQQQYYKPQIDGKRFGLGSSVPLYSQKQKRTFENQQKNYNYNNRSPQKLVKKFQTPQQPKGSPENKEKLQKTKQKNSIPIIKQDLQQGQQTIVNTINKNSNRNSKIEKNKIPYSYNKPSQFSQQKLQKIIDSQKKQSQPIKIINDYKKTYLNLNQQKDSLERKSSQKSKNQQTKRLGNTIDISSINRIKKSTSPIKAIHQTKYILNPYLLKNQYKRDKKNRSLSTRYMKDKSTIRNSSQNKNNSTKRRDRVNSHDKIQNKSKSQYFVNKNKSRQKYQQTHNNIQTQPLIEQSKDTSMIKRSRQICIPAPIFPASQQIQYNQSQLDHIRKLCNQKIQKRLQISTIVFKDSKLRNIKHQMDHLLSKFQNQIKGRKQIRDKINTNPRILRKHKMVVDKMTI